MSLDAFDKIILVTLALAPLAMILGIYMFNRAANKRTKSPRP